LRRLRRRILQSIPEQGRWLKLVITGYYAYHAGPTNFRSLGVFRDHVVRLWGRTLRRRSQKRASTWERIGKVADDWLHNRASFTLGRAFALPSNTRGKSRMRETRSSGSVRGASGDGRPYRER
jgi:hypothetical protein